MFARTESGPGWMRRGVESRQVHRCLYVRLGRYRTGAALFIGQLQATLMRDAGMKAMFSLARAGKDAIG
jgi:hypothetical protein